MLRIDCGPASRYCDGFSRRSFVQLGVAGMASASLADILRARAASAATTPAKQTSVILLWLDGGPSHMDLYDMKPQAPAEYRGLWNPIPTNVSGIEISELFPLQAQVADKFSLVRSLYHNQGDHFTGGHYMLTTRGGASGAEASQKYPGIPAIVSKLCGPRQSGMPAHVAVPYAMSIGLRPGYFGASYLGPEHNPFETVGDPSAENFTVQNLALDSALTLERLAERKELVAGLDNLRRDVDRSGMLEAIDRFQQDAYHLVTGEAAREAFDISREDARVRDEYGRHSWGQSTLLARRLVEAGTTWVSVHFGGWDHHWDLKAGMENYLPLVDRAVAALLRDLDQRGLWESTLVILCGEFSRTPRMNDGLGSGTPGRDHWGNSMFCLLGGGGIQGGRIVGSTNRLGDAPQDRPVTTGDLHATIYRALGIDPQVAFLNHAGRPVPPFDEGHVIEELF